MQYSNTIQTDFRPLEYIDIRQDKPLIIKLNNKYIFKCQLKSVNDFIIFSTNKTMILTQLEELNKLDRNNIEVQKTKVLYFKILIKLLYEISKSEYKGRIRKYFYYKFLNKFLLNDVYKLIEIMKHVLNYNTMLKKKLNYIQNINIFSNQYSDMTIGGHSLKELIRVDTETGEKYFVQ